jgi:hypothetical protein
MRLYLTPRITTASGETHVCGKRTAADRGRAIRVRAVHNNGLQAKEEIINRNYLRFFAPFFAAASLGAAVQSQETDRVIVNIPYDFIVSGKALTAGI